MSKIIFDSKIAKRYAIERSPRKAFWVVNYDGVMIIKTRTQSEATGYIALQCSKIVNV